MIKVKKGFVPRKEKVYLLLRKEKEKVCKFIKEQLRKGYIRFSKSPQIALVLLIERRMKRSGWYNYRYLNKWTIKNNYSLSLISKI